LQGLLTSHHTTLNCMGGLLAEPLHHNCFVLDASGNPLPFAPEEAAPSNASYTPAENQGIMCSTLDVWAGPQ
jgi:hypothetical protein